MKINELSPEQESALDRYAKKWEDIGISTVPIDMGRAVARIDDLYEALGMERPKQYWLCASPDDAMASIEESEGDDAAEHKNGWVGGGMWSGTYAWYQYCARELGIDDERLGELSSLVAEEVSIWWPFENVAVLSERPCEIHTEKFGERELSHRDGGPAIRWVDDTAIWCLRGVEVPQWLAETPAEEIDASRIKEIENVEVRREFIRKVGIERVYQSLGGKVIDSAQFESETGIHQYELVELHTYGESQDARPYLKMENPSLDGVYHLERVPLGTRTVRGALLFRNSLKEDQVDDENGAEWYQQGDVILRPRDATKYRFFPKVLT
jgi:hypothetical protein